MQLRSVKFRYIILALSKPDVEVQSLGEVDLITIVTSAVFVSRHLKLRERDIGASLGSAKLLGHKYKQYM